MTERDLMLVEAQIGEANALAAAAIAFAAICRIGEIGREAGEEFKRLARGADDDGDLSMQWTEGCAQIEDHLAV